MRFSKDELSEVFKAGFDFRGDMVNNPSNSEYVEQIFKEKKEKPNKEKQLELFFNQLNEEYKKFVKYEMGYVIFDLHTSRKSCHTSMPAEIDNFELIKVLPSDRITRLLYEYVG